MTAIVAAGGYLLLSGESSSTKPRSISQNQSPSPTTTPSAARQVPSSESPAPTQPPPPSEAPAVAAVTPTDARLSVPEVPENSSTPPIAAASAETSAATTAEAKSSSEESKTAATADAAPASSGGTVGAKGGGFEIVPSTIETNEDGSMLVDGRFRVAGDGTREKPYEIAWELLISAEEKYNPSEKKTQLPQSIAMLDGKFVRITGHVAFPLYQQEPRELLAMLNQWDGCCIGVPPTPYDAIEVQMNGAVAGDDRLATFGVIEGLFGVKPYVVGDWLVGLYVMERGELTGKRFGSGT